MMKHFKLLSVFTFLCICGQSAYAAGLDLDLIDVDTFDLAEGPLGLGIRPEANIQFVIDDSASMVSSIVAPDIANEGKAVMVGNVATSYYQEMFPPVDYAAGYVRANEDILLLPTQFMVDTWNGSEDATGLARPALADDLDGVWRYRNHSYNRIYYNPNRTYSPWPGYADADPNAALLDPSDPAVSIDLEAKHEFNSLLVPLKNGVALASETVTLEHIEDFCVRSVFILLVGRVCAPGLFGAGGGEIDTRVELPYYYEWSDNNNDGVIDADEAGAKIELTTAAELQNFANWFTYHRTKSLLARGAVLNAIDGKTNFRAALTTVHNNSNSHYEMASMEAIAASGSNKEAFISTVAAAKAYQHSDPSFGLDTYPDITGTPLRAALDRAGKYLSCESGSYESYYTGGSPRASSGANMYGNSNCPALPANDGGICQENYTVLATDGFNTTHAVELIYPGQPPGGGFTSGTTVVKNFNDPLALNAESDEDGDGFSDTMADVAHKYFANDINTTLDETQNIETVAVLTGNSNELDTSSGVPDPEPSSAGFTPLNSLLDLKHATENSGGIFVDGTIANDVSTALASLFRTNLAKNGAGTGASASANVLGAGQYLYQSFYDVEDLSGDIKAYTIDSGSQVAEAWSAAQKLGAKLGNNGSNQANRFVLTYNPSHIASEREGMEFNAANLSTTSYILGLPLPGVQSFDQILDQTDVGSLGLSGLLSGLLNLLLNDLLAGLLQMLGGITEDNLLEILDFRTPLDAATVNYIRGDQSNELQNGGTLRNRDDVLGPIYHSNIAYVPQIPNFDYPEGAFNASGNNSYSTFRREFIDGTKSRPPMIYVGGNDGMLHGFDALTGEEKLAYVPSILWDKLRDYPDQNHGVTAYVDGEISIVDAYGQFPMCDGGSCWRTILVGSLRAGGYGIYALDVTEPSEFTVGNVDAKKLVLWEFSKVPNSITGNLDNFLKSTLCNTLALSCTGPLGTLLTAIIDNLTDTLFPVYSFGDADVGLTYGKPKIGYLPNGQWAAVFNNGYNAGGDDPGTVGEVLGIIDALGGTEGSSVIYMVRLDGSSTERGSIISKFDTGAGLFFDPALQVDALGVVGSLSSFFDPDALLDSLFTALGEPPKITANGMSEVAIVDKDHPLSVAAADYGKIDLIYAGDLQGNLWRLHLDGTNPSQWGFSYGATNRSAGGQPLPMYNASIDSQRWQPLVNRPEIIRHPVEPDNFLVLFGTGKFIENSDAGDTDADIQSVYALWDRKTTVTTDSTPPADFIRSNFLKRNLTSETTVSSNTVRVSDNTGVINWDSSDSSGYHRGWYLDLIVGSSTGDGERVFSGPETRNGRVLFTSAVPSDAVCSSDVTSWFYTLNAADGARPFTPFIDFNGDGVFDSNDSVTVNGEAVSPSGSFSGEGLTEIPALVVDGAGRELQIRAGASGTPEVTTGNAAGYEHSRSTWKACLP